MDRETAWQELDAMVNVVMTATGTPGLSLAVTDRDGLLTARSYGYANLDAKAPVREETLFESGSIGKSFTAIAFMQLAAEGKVELQAPITHYLPWFEVQSQHESITIHHLLTHTSGLIGGSDFVPGARYEVWALRRTKTFAAPGQHFCYSNAGYKVLGLALEAIEQKPYAQIIKERIFDRIGMAASWGSITHEMRPLLAVGYSDRFDDRPSLPEDGLVPATWLETDTGDGCLAVNAVDLATYLRVLMNEAAGPHGALLGAGQFETMRYPHIGDSPAPTYGYGLKSDTGDGKDRFGHSGGMVGYTSQMLGDLDTGYGVVVLCNTFGPTTEVASYALDLLKALERGSDRPALPSLANDPFVAEEGEALAGSYTDGEIDVQVVAEGDRLDFVCDGERRPLRLLRPGQPEGPWVIEHPEFSRAAVRFGRSKEDASAGPVVEMFVGTRWFRGERYTGQVSFEVPPEWQAYIGHYRSHNPWGSSFRIAIEKDRLVMVMRGQVVPLKLDGDGFLVGSGEVFTDNIAFDAIVNGQALVCRYASGAEYSRFFTP